MYAATQSPPAQQVRGDGAVVAVVRYGATNAADDRALAERYLGYAGVRDEDVVTSRFLAHLHVCGAAPVASAGGLPGRPGVTVGGGVFVAGDWVGPEGLIGDAALASGEAAARAALAYLQRPAPVAA